ncbi:MAG TPA: hypothetical protein VFU02_00015 [Polyangiaceae bacterium]|nr:hypothetical protein [Polyangiaceae bacterium]
MAFRSSHLAFAWWRRSSTFVTLWTLAVIAATTAFVLYLALRTRSIELGYELGRAHGRVARLREVRRVLELELSSYKTPERVDLVSRTLLGMDAPGADRILALGKQPEPPRGPQTAPDTDESEGVSP